MKLSLSINALDEVGAGYCTLFKRRHKHSLVGKRGAKFDLDRANWCNYQNIRLMFDMIEE